MPAFACFLTAFLTFEGPWFYGPFPEISRDQNGSDTMTFPPSWMMMFMPSFT